MNEKLKNSATLEFTIRDSLINQIDVAVFPGIIYKDKPPDASDKVRLDYELADIKIYNVYPAHLTDAASYAKSAARINLANAVVSALLKVKADCQIGTYALCCPVAMAKHKFSVVTLATSTVDRRLAEKVIFHNGGTAWIEGQTLFVELNP